MKILSLSLIRNKKKKLLVICVVKERDLDIIFLKKKNRGEIKKETMCNKCIKRKKLIKSSGKGLGGKTRQLCQTLLFN